MDVDSKNLDEEETRHEESSKKLDEQEKLEKNDLEQKEGEELSAEMSTPNIESLKDEENSSKEDEKAKILMKKQMESKKYFF